MNARVALVSLMLLVASSACTVGKMPGTVGSKQTPGAESAMPGSSSGAMVPSTSADVLAATVAGGRVWALTNNGLMATSDDGSSWTAIDVPGLDVSAALAIGFAAESGWIVVQRSDATTLGLFATHDGGGSWTSTTLPGSFPDGVSSIGLDPLDNSNVWIAIKLPFSSAESIGYGLHSSDGGKTWSAIDLPNGDPVAFHTAQDGWQAGGPVNQHLHRTTDGGKTWEAVTLPVPPQQKGDRVAYSNPTFFGDSGVLPVYLSLPGRGPLVVAFYVTRDGGQSWALATTLQASPEGASAPVLVAAPNSWLVETSQGLEATRDGVRFSATNATGLGEVSALLRPNGSTLWAVAASSTCDASKTNCTTKRWLEKSGDGGHTWVTDSP